MGTVTVIAPAKLNLTLDIVGKRQDGYHFVDMVMQSVSLFDSITVKLNNTEKITLQCNKSEIPIDSSNTAYKAAQLYLKEVNSNSGVSIAITKNIPSQAGLAGGSADGAGVLVALNYLFSNKLTTDKLLDLGASIGADVPFCINGGIQHATGIGTTLCSINECMPECYIVLVKPKIGVSTKLAYEKCDENGYAQIPHSKKLFDSLKAKSLKALSNCLYNDFEAVLNITEVNSIKAALTENGAIGACMSGSGPTVFGIFADKSSAEACAALISNNTTEVFITTPINYGVKILTE